MAKLIDVVRARARPAKARLGMKRPRDEIGTNVGVHDNPADSTEYSLDRHALRNTSLQATRMADPQRWPHALRGPGLPGKACSLGAIIQYTTGIVDFHEENCIAAATASPAARSTCRASSRKTTRRMFLCLTAWRSQ